jgi:hypothetical protein
MFAPRLGSVRTTDSEEQNQWSHRADLKIDQRHRAFGAIVEENRQGELITGEELARFMGWLPEPSEIHPHHEPTSEPEEYDGSDYDDRTVEEMKMAEKYRKRYGSSWSDETKEQAQEKYHERRRE